MKSVWIIMSQDGSILLNIFTNKGTVYADRETAEKALESKNEWARARGYCRYELIELEVEE